MNLQQWRRDPARWERLHGCVTDEEAGLAYMAASASMGRLNLRGARAMRRHGAHGATDVTGFGLLGHAANLARCQKAAVDIEITAMPLLPYVLRVRTSGGAWRGRGG